jgi:hypothetical protein
MAVHQAPTRRHTSIVRHDLADANTAVLLLCALDLQGTFSPGNGKSCTKCTGGFYADVAGLASCKRCPTKWACLAPNKVLGRFATTPYRQVDPAYNVQLAAVANVQLYS